MWSICRYNVIKMRKMLKINIMHGIGSNLMCGGQKMVTVTVFWPDDKFTWHSLVMNTGYFGVT